jgi:hypothetical protein
MGLLRKRLYSKFSVIAEGVNKICKCQREGVKKLLWKGMGLIASAQKWIKLIKMLKKLIGIIVLILIGSTPALAAHPLITDDTGTQGTGNVQLELNSEFGHSDGNGLKEATISLTTVLSYGIVDQLDVVLGVPFLQLRTEDSGTTTTERGISDTSIEIKWRFYEKDGFSLALKPGIILPTGNESKGLGNGKVNYSFFFIGTKELEPWTFHLNLGYIRHENNREEKKDIWHASLASEFNLTKKLKAVANIGTERNPDPSSDMHPAFLLGGLVYSLTEKINLDLGANLGLNRADNYYSLLAGICFKF